jgi:hypothetical protein
VRGFGRAAILGGLLLSPFVMVAVAVVELHPYRLAEIPLMRLAELPERTPVFFSSRDLDGLDYHARLIRNRSAPAPLMQRGGHGDLPVYLVREGDMVHGFIAADPLTGCRLDLLSVVYGSYYGAPTATVFHDRCWGSTYTLRGRPNGGPGLWTLDELVLRQADGILYASTIRICAGELLGRG